MTITETLNIDVIAIIKNSPFVYSKYSHRIRFDVDKLDICLWNYGYNHYHSKYDHTELTNEEIKELHKRMVKEKLKGTCDFKSIADEYNEENLPK